MEEKTTPMMQQWHGCKAKAKDALLLFRLGDFYEAFYQDAHTLSNALDVTLTKRGDVPMSGIPAHTLDNYLDKLIGQGLLVAIAEQVEDPGQAKGIVRREIVRIISPGAVYNPSLLSEKTNNYFGCLCLINSRSALAYVDITTGEAKVVETEDVESLFHELVKLSPSELIVSEKSQKHHFEALKHIQEKTAFRLTIKPEWHFDYQICYQFLTAHFNVHNLDGFGFKGLTASVNALGALLTHITDDLSLSIKHIIGVQTYYLEDFLIVDSITQRHLEIVQTMSLKKEGSLLHHLDRTKTPMGGRLFRHWVLKPLKNKKDIDSRLECTQELMEHSSSINIEEHLKHIKDLERLILRISTNHSSPRDLVALRYSLEQIGPLKQILESYVHPLLKDICASLQDFSLLVQALETTLVDNPPIKVGEGQLIKPCVDTQLDELRVLKNDSEDFLWKYQEKLKEQTGIKTLKVGFSKAFGYFIDVSRAQSSKVPPSFHKRQTLVNNERFITEELRDFEHKILSAEETIAKLEQKLYQELKELVCSYEKPILQASAALAFLDCLHGLYYIARLPGYTQPLIVEDQSLEIQEGRHPILDSQCPFGTFIPNDTLMDLNENKLFLITGPNMAGKSTYMRQVALLCMMAQIGCFIPAKSGKFGLIDKIFSRIGASDDLARGQSTFMVEMTETANILRHTTSKSLVILDEIGRGTSTFDGISIAWAVAEYLLSKEGKSCKTLFATHYCELTELEEKFKGVVNYHIAVKEADQGISFLRKICKGGTDKSYGIHVAKLAGLPYEVIIKAQEVLKNLEQKHVKSWKKPAKKEVDQFLLFQEPPRNTLHDKILEEFKKTDLLQTTPMQALHLLETLQAQLQM
jgi:DNA mismatch repair protein MutS